MTERKTHEMTMTFPCGCGDRVRITEIESLATVKSISIGHGGIQYELSWFSNGDLKTAWFTSDAFTV